MSFLVTTAIQKEDDWYVAKCLDNDIASQGKTIDEAMANLQEALELFYEDLEDVPIFKKTFVTTMEIAI